MRFFASQRLEINELIVCCFLFFAVCICCFFAIVILLLFFGILHLHFLCFFGIVDFAA